MAKASSRVGLTFAAIVAWFARRPLRRLLDRLGFIIFGQRAQDSDEVTWLPGHGSHGGDGGQTPPYVPYSSDWDPKNRTR